MMRPQSIILFERLIFTALFLTIIEIYLRWDGLMTLMVNMPVNPVAFILITQIFSITLTLILTLLISRRRNKVALWISIALFILSLRALYKIYAEGALSSFAFMTIINVSIEFVAYGLLFLPSSKDWLNYADKPTQRY